MWDAQAQRVGGQTVRSGRSFLKPGACVSSQVVFEACRPPAVWDRLGLSCASGMGPAQRQSFSTEFSRLGPK
jgi:hypothetical protein